MLTVLEIIKRTTEFFAGKGIESPRLNAELLIGHALGRTRMQLYMEFERPLAEAELEKIRPLVRRRGQREPLQYIVGEVEFHGLKLKVDKRALIPRPETELLVAHVVALCAANPPTRLLDLGTGSGAIAIALATMLPTAAVTAVDVSAEALAIARENAATAGAAGRIEFLTSDWFAALSGQSFDVIVGNPPYLSASETAETAPEVRGFEPAMALTAPGDGLEHLARIIADAPRYLNDGGLLALETGIAQHARLRELLAAAGFTRTESRQDLTGRDRFVFGWR
ncbi:MAG: peptide chain release factor N(5)-glutamine methyltransferase [Opitutaceae bacterium]|nr:peptide chain release factor N(5)-glutamine methyltransferase [Opitutaceae bacterium]